MQYALPVVYALIYFPLLIIYSIIFDTQVVQASPSVRLENHHNRIQTGLPPSRTAPLATEGQLPAITAQSLELEELPGVEDFEPQSSCSTNAEELTQPDSDTLAEEPSRDTVEVRNVEIEVVGNGLFDKDDFRSVYAEVGIQLNLSEGTTQTVNLPQLINLGSRIE